LSLCLSRGPIDLIDTPGAEYILLPRWRLVATLLSVIAFVILLQFAFVTVQPQYASHVWYILLVCDFSSLENGEGIIECRSRSR
jgi:hypothetical protein